MKNNKAASGTFTLNKKEPIHRWYSYIEGYSSCLIEDIFDELKNENIKTVILSQEQAQRSLLLQVGILIHIIVKQILL